MTKKFLFALLFATRVTRLVAWLNRSKVTILCYHSVTKQWTASAGDPHKLHLPIGSFISHLSYLQTHYRIVSLAEFVRARRENIKLPSSAAILTFDDGFRNFLTVVAPILLARRIPATAFILTGENFIRESSALNEQWSPEDDSSYLSWSDVRQLADQGLELGSHTCSHYALPELSLAEARGELEKSLNTLVTHLGSSNFPLSYPHGRTSKEVSLLAESLGYSCAVTTALGQNDFGSDLFALRRTVIASDDDLPTFAARLSGLTGWYFRIGSLLNTKPTTRLEEAATIYDPIEEFES